jgi:DNA polymerase I-like protein with 3'-5' exonuclease and polymerase domains
MAMINKEPMFLDIETDGFLESMSKIHVVAVNRKGFELVGNEQLNHVSTLNVKAVLEDIMDWDGYLVAHNGIKFDIPAIQKVYPWFTLDETKVIDTLVLSRLIYPNIGDIDSKLIAQAKLPSKLWGSHSLEAWGYRLGEHKGNYAENFKAQAGADYVEGSEWKEWSQDMEDYCVQDVTVLQKLYNKLMEHQYSQEAIYLEHRVAFIIAKMERNGFMFNQEKAGVLLAELVGKRIELEAKAQTVFNPWYSKVAEVIPKVNNKSTGVTKGVPYTKVKLNLFNCGSRDHIADRLTKVYGWKPEVMTDGGKPKIDDVVLSKLDYPEAKVLAEYFMIAKRISQLHEGDQAWTRHIKSDGRIHGSVNTNGAVTGRATHASPNIGQVPACGSPYGSECRELFCVPQGKKLVGADLSGLELRCLAHYMGRYDGGAYGKVLLEGDIHTVNQESAGLQTRAQAKTFIYGFLYGAGAQKIGSIVGKGAKEGQKLKDRFLAKTPALKKLVSAVQEKAKSSGFLIGLDGRKLHVRSAHSALNTLLQSAGALIAKQALVELDVLLTNSQLHPKVKLVAWVHDEVQLECDEDVADLVGQLCIKAFKQAGEHFNFRCPIDGEYKVGNNWRDTH